MRRLLVSMFSALCVLAFPSPRDFGQVINQELAQNSKVIKAVGMKAD